MPTIKKRNQNEYLLTERGHWVRNFTKAAQPIDINDFTSLSDYRVFIENEVANRSGHLAYIDSEFIYAPNVVIASDGYDFENSQSLLAKIATKSVTTIGTNHVLSKLKPTTRIDYFVANNPYQQCMSCLSPQYYPRCVVSCRTYPEFIKRYRKRRGVVYQYAPSVNSAFADVVGSRSYHVDDYRNPICAAICLAYHWQVRKLLLFACDDSFNSERPAAEQLTNGLWMYPQHHVSHSLIDGMLHWLLNANPNMIIRSHSSGPEYKLAPYITSDELARFF